MSLGEDDKEICWDDGECDLSVDCWAKVKGLENKKGRKDIEGQENIEGQERQKGREEIESRETHEEVQVVGCETCVHFLESCSSNSDSNSSFSLVSVSSSFSD